MFIGVQKSSEFVGATRRVARAEFGVKGDKALFLTLGTFLSVFIWVHLCPDKEIFGCGFAALGSSVSCINLGEVPNEP